MAPRPFDIPDMKLALCALVLLLAGCTATVWHPDRTREQMEADIARCTDEADRRYSLDAVAAMLDAFSCLEEMGYRRQHSGLAARVEEDLKQRPRPAPSAPPPGAPCQVPCR